jgi:hypothetical protein
MQASDEEGALHEWGSSYNTAGSGTLMIFIGSSTFQEGLLMQRWLAILEFNID